MARKKKIQIEKFPGVPRGHEHVAEDHLAGKTLPRLTEAGAEILSAEPVVLHVNRRTVTDLEQLRSAIQNLRAHDGPITFESFQEADDFDLEDDFGDFHSKWEIPADQPTDITVEQYLRFRETGELPAHLHPQDNPTSTGVNPQPVSERPASPTPSPEGKPSQTAVAPSPQNQ